MSGIGDQGMLPEGVQSQHPDDDTMEDDLVEGRTAAPGDDESADAGPSHTRRSGSRSSTQSEKPGPRTDP